MRRFLVLPAFLGALLLACGGSGTSSPSTSGSSGVGASSGSGSPGASGGTGNSASGTVDGTPVQITSAIAHYGTVTLADVPGVWLTLSSAQNTCERLAGTTFSAISITMPGTIAPGSYAVVSDSPSAPVAQPGQATAGFDLTTNCVGGSGSHASSGTITVTAADGSHVAGTFDIVFDGGHASGSFDAIVCDVDGQIADDCFGSTG